MELFRSHVLLVVGRGGTFDLLASTPTYGPSFVKVEGTGVVSGNGFDPTVATWSFTNGIGRRSTFTFLAGSKPAGDQPEEPEPAPGQGLQVPEGGASLALMGLGLMGIAALRKKLAAWA